MSFDYKFTIDWEEIEDLRDSVFERVGVYNTFYPWDRFDMDALRRAIHAGLGLQVHLLAGGSLEFLREVIEEIPRLHISSVDALTDVDVLENAKKLRWLLLDQVRSRGKVDLSELPALRTYSGTVSPFMRSLFDNPNLREV